MGDTLKRWNGSQWVNVASVKRIVIQNGESGLLVQPTYGDPVAIPSDVPTLSPDSGLGQSYSYQITYEPGI